MTRSLPTILLVDDEKDFLETLAKRLALRNYRILLATSGPMALETLTHERVDLVILDVKMPGMDGITALSHIKKNHPGVEVIMLTGHADLQASLEGMRLGFFDYLTKPVEIKRLVAKIEHALAEEHPERKRAVSSSFTSKMEEKMVFADRLASLGTLAAGVAHEINNPLAIISEAAGWLQSKVSREKEIPEELRDSFHLALGKIESSVDRAQRISQGLLSFARQTDSVARKVDLLDLAKEVIELTRKTASHKQVCATAALDRGNAVVTVDPYLLRQVLLDLTTNAIQAVGREGKVDLVVGGEKTFGWVEVRDNGSGIEEEYLEKIFEPFFTTKPAGEGTGLGLAVSRSIVEKLGGRIEVASSPGQGACFKIWVPKEPTTASPGNTNEVDRSS